MSARIAVLFTALVLIGSPAIHASDDDTHRYYDQGEIDLNTLRRARSISRRNGEPVVNEIRAEALKETALMYGSRAGLYARMRVINQILDQRAPRLDQVFQFAPLMLSHDVVPPVVQVGYDNQRLHEGDVQTLRLTDALYDIVQDAQFAHTPPDWRTYLYLAAAKPEPPDESLMPDRGESAEVALWEEYIQRGWQAGLQQADRTFEVQLNRLVRDLTGMALYRELLAKEMVTPPRVSEKFLGLTGSRKTLAVNDRLLSIDVAAAFVMNNQRWKPYANKPVKRRKRYPEIAIQIHPDPPPARLPDPPPVPARPTRAQAWERR